MQETKTLYEWNRKREDLMKGAPFDEELASRQPSKSLTPALSKGEGAFESGERERRAVAIGVGMDEFHKTNRDFE